MKKGKKHIAEQFPLIQDEKARVVRITFDLRGPDAERFDAVLAMFANIEASDSQVAKMLLKIGLKAAEEGKL